MESPAVVPHRSRRATALLLTAVAVAGCGRAVGVDAPDVAPSTQAACAALARELPQHLGDQPRLAVTPDTGTTAAWGTPAIVWRCGVAVPAAFGPASQLVRVDKVDWFPEELSNGARFTSVRTSPVTEVSVPVDYANAAEYLTQLPTP